MECPCDGKMSRHMHAKRAWPQCEAVRQQRRQEEVDYERKPRTDYMKWVPGTSIEVPEIDPL